MARPPRLEIEDGLYHVTARGNERGTIFRDDGDHRRFLELLADVRERYSWRILSYCLMANHYHLLLQTLEPNLACGMRQLNGVYAQWFNRRHDRVGHVLQGRYMAKLVQADEHLLVVARYIARNPVRAGLCQNPSEWRWSSHRAILGEEPLGVLDGDVLLSRYGTGREVAIERYRAHTEKPTEDEHSAHPLIEGDERFVATMLEGCAPAPGVPRRYFQAVRPALPSLLGPRKTDDAIVLAYESGYSLREIARHVGVNASTISRRLKRQRVRSRTATEET